MTIMLHEYGCVVRARFTVHQQLGMKRQVSTYGQFGSLVVLTYPRAARLLERGVVELVGGHTMADFRRAEARYRALEAEASV